MSTVIKKLQVMSRNRSFLIGEVGKIVRLLLPSQFTNAETDSIFSALKCYTLQTYTKHASGQLWETTVHKNILDNINLADVVSELVDRKDSCKQTFRHFSQNSS